VPSAPPETTSTRLASYRLSFETVTNQIG